MLYVQLDQRLFNDIEDEITVKTARTLVETAKLIEVGFQLADPVDGIRLYRKRKLGVTGLDKNMEKVAGVR